MVISDRLWRGIYGGDPNVIGKTMKAENNEVTIAGVMAPGFLGIQADTGVDMFAPHDTIIPRSAERRPVGQRSARAACARASPSNRRRAEITARWPALLEQARSADAAMRRKAPNIIGATPASRFGWRTGHVDIPRALLAGHSADPRFDRRCSCCSRASTSAACC